jgi:Putative nucleotidyltransferase DUF294
MLDWQNYFRALLVQIETHYNANRYHCLLDNIIVAISMLESPLIDGLLLPTQEDWAKLIKLCATCLPVLNRQVEEWQFQEYLYDLVDRLQKLTSNVGSLINDDLNELFNEIGSGVSPYKKNNYKKLEYSKWEAVPTEERDQIVRLQQALRNLANTPEHKILILVCLFDTVFPYMSVAAKKISQEDFSPQGYKGLIKTLLLIHLGKENQGWRVIHFYYFFHARCEASYLLPNATAIGQLQLHAEEEDPVILLQRCRLSVDNCSSAEDWQVLLDILITINKQIPDVRPPPVQVSLLDDYPHQLEKARAVFDNKPAIDAQREFTKFSLHLLSQLLEYCMGLLGKPPCKIALLALGSTSREDRMPYSDIELALLHSAPEDDIKRVQIDAYISTLLRLLELSIICLNESPLMNVENDSREGFRIDSSTHILADPDLRGTPEDVFTKKIVNILRTDPDQLIDNASFYSLLQATLVNNNSSAKDLFIAYQQKVSNFLMNKLSPEDVQKLWNKRLQRVNLNLDYPITYRQAIAFFCLSDVLEKSQEQSAQEINIKKTYYKPLVYFCLSLKIYYNLPDKHPEEILQTCLAKKLLSEGFCKLFKEALDFVLTLRIHLHLTARRQKEIVEMGDLSLPKDKRLKLETIYEGIIKPLHDAVQAYLMNNSLADELKALFRNIETTITWPQKIQALCSSTPSCCQIETPFCSGKRYLPKEIASNLFDEAGQLKRDNKVSSPVSHVKRIILPAGDFYFKCRPEDPIALFGREYAVAYLYEGLGGTPVPGTLLKLTVETQNNKRLVHWVWVCETVAGETLAKTMERNPQRLSALDSSTYTQLFLLALLTCPEDGQPHNFIVQGPNPQGCYYLRSIDNGHVFVNSSHEEGFFTKIRIDIKTMIYLLDNINQPLSQAVVKQVQSLDVDHLIDTWRAHLEELNKNYQPLLKTESAQLNSSPIPQTKDNKDHGQNNFSKLSSPEKVSIEERTKDSKNLPEKSLGSYLENLPKYRQLLALPESTIEAVRFRLHCIQDFFKESDISSQTHWDILRKLDPKLAVLYSRFIGQIRQPQDYYKINLKAYAPNVHGRMYSITTAKQLEERMLSPVKLRELMGLGNSFFDNRNFMGIYQNQQRFYFAMIKGLAFTSLELSNCSELTDSTFESLLKASPDLRTLRLTNCSSLTIITLKKSGWFWKMSYPALSKVSITDCAKLKELKIDGANLEEFEAQNCTSLRNLYINANKKIKTIILENIPLDDAFVLLLNQDLRLSKIPWDTLNKQSKEWIRSMMQDEEGSINLLNLNRELKRWLGILIPILFDKKKSIKSFVFSFYGISNELESLKLALRNHPDIRLVEMDNKQYNYNSTDERNRFWHVFSQNEANLNSTSSSTQENSSGLVETVTTKPNSPVVQDPRAVSYSIYDPVKEFANKYDKPRP